MKMGSGKGYLVPCNMRMRESAICAGEWEWFKFDLFLNNQNFITDL